MKKLLLYIALSLVITHADAQKTKTKTPEPAGVKLTSASLGKIDARHIGPAVTGGRITSIDHVYRHSRRWRVEDYEWWLGLHTDL
jgi:hypothetical protein